MKKILLLASFMYASICFAQEVLSTYTMNYFPGEKFEIQVDNSDQKNPKIYFGTAPAETIVKKIDILIPLNEVDKFKSDLLKCKEVYLNWKKTAIENKVSELDKNIDVKFNKFDVAFLFGSKWNLSFSRALTPRFKIVNGKYIFILSNETEISSSSNRYMTTKGLYIVLNDDQEFDNIINILDVDKINSLFNSKKKTDELFK
ncbi:MAG: hypothetical protein ACN6OJ_15040 [Chryseobacterium sp.]|uniref:hypothetical protein n=1 Tax=Chryseobacterium sp. TaxID=1871047 RepID=UPI003D11F25A